MRNDKASWKLIFLVPFLISLASCRLTVQPYQEPETGDTAIIEFISEADEIMGVSLYEGSKECTDRLGAGPVEERAAKSIKVSSEENVVFTASMDVGSGMFLFSSGIALGGAFGGLLVDSALEQGCSTTLQFSPQAGRHYIFRMFSDGEGCGYQLFEKPSSDNSNKAKEVSYTKREWIRPTDEAGPFCKK